MEKIKVLNLYAGIGGNRKLWKNVDVTAIEINPEIAKIYKDFFPDDKVVVTDAHQYLLEHFQEFDFIWSSPPCPSHSKLNFSGRSRGEYKFPDMKLYEEIIFLKYWFKGGWVVENVIPYYETLIKPYFDGRHCYWSSFIIPKEIRDKKVSNDKYFNLDKKMVDRGMIVKNWYNYKGDKRTLINNCVDSKAGLHIFDCAFRTKQKTLSGGYQDGLQEEVQEESSQDR